MLKVELTGSEACARLEQWDRDWNEGPAGIIMSGSRYHNTLYNILHLHLLDSILTLTFISYLLYQSNSLYLAS